MTWKITVWRTGQAEFDKLADYASIGAIIYGIIAVTLDLGVLAMFYTIGAIIKYVGERKGDQDAKAIQRVVNNPALLRRANETARQKESESVSTK